MNNFMERLTVIPKPARVIAFLMFAGVAATMFIGPLRHEADTVGWPIIAKLAVAGLVGSVAGIYALIIGFVYGDARSRRMRHVMWTWLAALVPNAIGIVLYFILRDPLPRPCPSCSKPVPSSFVFCPHCGAANAPRCSNCGKAMEREWTHCAHCGVPAHAGTNPSM